MFKRICKITFIAHGSTVFSENGIINDNLKSPKLNENGENEIEDVCAYLRKRGVSYDRIYSGPEAYCTQSAQIVAKMFNKKVLKTDLHNRNHGDWNGQSNIDIFKNFGTAAFAQTPDNGESIKDFNKRVASKIKEIIYENEGNRVIIVTTPEIIQSALADTLGLNAKNQYKNLIKTGSLTQISYFKGWSSVIYSDYKPIQ